MIGKTISHYRVVEKLGGRGMGMTYNAEVTRLHRFLGVEVLAGPPAEKLGDFLYELVSSPSEQIVSTERSPGFAALSTRGQAASAPNHPKICTGD